MGFVFKNLLFSYSTIENSDFYVKDILILPTIHLGNIFYEAIWI
jgi:hypothetical protein